MRKPAFRCMRVGLAAFRGGSGAMLTKASQSLHPRVTRHGRLRRNRPEISPDHAICAMPCVLPRRFDRSTGWVWRFESMNGPATFSNHGASVARVRRIKLVACRGVMTVRAGGGSGWMHRVIITNSPPGGGGAIVWGSPMLPFAPGSCTGGSSSRGKLACVELGLCFQEWSLRPRWWPRTPRRH